MSDDDSLWRLSPADLRQLELATFVWQVEHHRELRSTNELALERAIDPAQAVPLLVTTDCQTAGRGRTGKRWWSADGALTFSLVLDRNDALQTRGWPQLALTAGIAVCEALHQLAPGLDASLKWPNDVYVQLRKICGILIEAPPPSAQRVVIGIGLNVNNRFTHAPPELQESATSLVDVVGYPVKLASVLGTLLEHLSRQLERWNADPAAIQRQWETYCMLTGHTVTLVAGGQKVLGVCQGIDARGALLLETAQGIEPFFSGEVISW